MEGKYSVTYACTNCFFEAGVYFELGTKALLSFECPNCGNKTLERKKLGYFPFHYYVCKGGRLAPPPRK